MVSGPPSLRLAVLLAALMVSTVSLAGCHDLENTFQTADELDPTHGEDDSDPIDEDEGPEGDGTDDETSDGNGDNGNGDGGNGDDGNGDDGNGDNGDGNGGNGGGNGDDGDGKDATDPPAVEEGDFEGDHVVEIVSSLLTNCTDEAFDPDPLEIAEGEVVRWMNNGTCGHTATSGDEYDEHDGHFDTGTISVGEESEFGYRFNEAGTYNYYCKFHPNMPIAQVIVE